MALRGDPQEGPRAPWVATPGGLDYASDLVELARSRGDFTVGVAAFPEGHPTAASLDHDADVLVAKARAGAEFAVTQMFFRASDYFALVDRVRARGVDIPILPGIMPILNLDAIRRQGELIGTAVPDEVVSRISGAGDAAAIRSAGHRAGGRAVRGAARRRCAGPALLHPEPLQGDAGDLRGAQRRGLSDCPARLRRGRSPGRPGPRTARRTAGPPPGVACAPAAYTPAIGVSGPSRRRTVARPCQSTPYDEPPPVLDLLPRGAVHPGDQLLAHVDPAPGQCPEHVLGESAAAVHRPRGAARRGLPPVRTTSIGSPCRTSSCGQVGHLAASGRGGRPPAGSRAWCAPTSGARVGSRRGSIAQTTRSASSSPASVRHRGHPATAHTRSVRRRCRSAPSTPRVSSRAPAPSPSPAIPPGHGPGAEALLEVGDQPGPGRHVAQVVPVGHERVTGHQPRAGRPGRTAQPAVQGLPAAQPGGHVPGQGRRGATGSRSSRGAAPPSPRCTRRRRRPSCSPEPGPELVEGRDLGRPRAPGQSQHGVVLEAVLADHGPAARAPAPAPAAGRTCGTGRGAPRAAAWRSGRRPR